MAMELHFERSSAMEMSLFEAAVIDDSVKFREALARGADINEQDPQMLGMTPLHVACIYNSHACIAVAFEEAVIDPWIKDDNLRLSFDHAAAHNNKPAMDKLHKLLYTSSPWHNFTPTWS